MQNIYLIGYRSSTKIDHVLDYKIILNKFYSIEAIHSMFSIPSDIKVEKKTSNNNNISK